jgi:hypothetical protein
VQTPFPPPGFVPPPFNFFDFVCLYVALIELIVLALPRKIRCWILETLFPILRH